MEYNEILKNISPEQLKELSAAIEAKELAKVVFSEVEPKSGRPLQTLGNYQELFKHYQVSIKYNEMSKETEIIIPGYKNTGDLYNNAVIGKLRDLCYQNGLLPTELDSCITVIADDNQYHPVKTWLDAIHWDGQDRLQDYYNSITLDGENPMKEVMLKKWALSLVAALYHPGFSCEGVLTFSGKQGQGKTIWVEELIPREYHNVWNKDAVTLDVNNKDSLFKALSYWITELGELDSTFKKSDIEALKGFITEKVDMIRSPYDRKANKYPRRTVFYATVNDDEFLQDTQNRRFWVLAIREFNLGKIDVGQFWAQIKQEYLKVKDKIGSGALRKKNDEYGWFMSPSEREVMAPLQESFKSVDPVEEKISVTIKPLAETGHSKDWCNATEILERCGYMRPSRRDCHAAGKALKKMGFIPNGQKKYGVEFYSSGTWSMANTDNISVKLVDKIKR
jgi:putative DNA primase/helicase